LPFLLRHPWLGSLLLGAGATPLAIALAALAPWLGVVTAWPLLILMEWAGPGYNIGRPEQPFYEGTPIHLMAITLGLLFTWLSYIFLARVGLWQVTVLRGERDPAA
jgi:hypothetical protein